MKKIVLIGIFLFLFFFLFMAFVEAEADCPVCPSNHPVWNVGYQVCQSPAGTEWPTYVDPTYVDCGNYPCIPGQGCQTTPGEGEEYDPCWGMKSEEYDKCDACIEGRTLPEGKAGSWTALGCISTEPQGFISWLLQKVIGIAGGIAFLLILFGGFQILTSTGDPEKLASGKDIVVSALAGLLMIIFSVLLLRIIGVDILQIPGLGG